MRTPQWVKRNVFLWIIGNNIYFWNLKFRTNGEPIGISKTYKKYLTPLAAYVISLIQSLFGGIITGPELLDPGTMFGRVAPG
jgi:hypothetical protein